jgi:ATP-dependent exoDNAse (exonuclease V) alpha subunit
VAARPRHAERGRGQHAPRAADLIVVDEASMLDVLLANTLVKAARRSCA